MKSPDQERPAGISVSLQTLDIVPPAVDAILTVVSTLSKYATADPSGENAGLSGAPQAAPDPGVMARASKAPSSRTYSRRFNTYATREPSGEIAIPGLTVSCRSSAYGTTKRVTGAAAEPGRMNFVAAIVMPAVARTAMAIGTARRHSGRAG